MAPSRRRAAVPTASSRARASTVRNKKQQWRYPLCFPKSLLSIIEHCGWFGFQGTRWALGGRSRDGHVPFVLGASTSYPECFTFLFFENVPILHFIYSSFIFCDFFTWKCEFGSCYWVSIYRKLLHVGDWFSSVFLISSNWFVATTKAGRTGLETELKTAWAYIWELRKCGIA